MATPFQRELDFACDLAREAGEVTLKYFQSGVQPDFKNDSSPVTVADLEAEKLIRKRIEEVFPGDGVLGEEYGEQKGEKGRRWIVDPIDGTKTFVQGVPLYAVLIGLEIEGELEVGVVNIPALGELIFAARGGGCFLNDTQVKVSDVSTVGESCLAYTCFSNFDLAGERGLKARDRLATSCRVMRGWGDAYGYTLVATGRAEAVFDPIINPWDIACMVPIIEEAGGKLTDWDGTRSIFTGHAFASNGTIHDELLGTLKG